MHSDDECWMSHALELAEGGRGFVEPNPLVGAVVVRDGAVVGAGRHERFGGPHAEVHALAQAGPSARGATLYVTLEPCCHHGKTPPCTDAIVRAGIARVVAALEDPFPQVAGRGARLLAEAGIPLAFGPGASQARRQNAPYLKRLATGLPYVHLKWAMTLDGKTATRTGDSQWISNEAARRRVHELRGRMDAIVVGIGTALADDPLLTARPPGPRVPCRVLLDPRARLPLEAQLVRTARAIPTRVLVREDADPARLDALRLAGCRVDSLPLLPDCDTLDLRPFLLEGARQGWTNVLVEGGAETHGRFLDQQHADEVHVFLAPLLLGGRNASPAVAGLGGARLADALRLDPWTVEDLAGNLYLRAMVQPPGSV